MKMQGDGISSNGRAAILLLVFAFLLLPLASVSAGTISEGFPSEENLPDGALVSLRDTVPSSVELASLRNSNFLYGVVESGEASLITINNPSPADLNVATSGQVLAFVSDINGAISAGDLIGASWIEGIGMKAAQNIQEQKLLGVAVQNLNTQGSNIVEQKDVVTPSGSVDAKIGRIVVRLFAQGARQPDADSVLEDFAAKIAGKEVPFSRVLAAFLLFLIALIISGMFLASAIRGSFVSLGRNPLASASVFNSLMQVSSVAVSLVLIGAVLSYLILVL